MAKVTCDGACCVAFYFTASHETMRTRAAKTADQAILKDMLVPLTRAEAIERRRKFNVPMGGMDKLGDEKVVEDDHWFKCRHWDEDTRLCGIYEDRPKMCRDFPYAKKCEYGCSYRPPSDIIQQYIESSVREKATPK